MSDSTVQLASLHAVEPDRLAEKAEEFCDAMLGRVSRTFALSIQTMPSSLRRPVRTAYLLCRVIDTVEDEPGLDHSARLALFNRFDEALLDPSGSLEPFKQAVASARLADQQSDGTLCQGADLVFEVFRGLEPGAVAAIRAHVAEMSVGMRAYCTRAALRGRWAISDLMDLERYCFYVAGTVGNLLTDLFEQHVDGMEEAARLQVRELAVRFGLGLQLVNILKDVADDASRGVCFLPEAEARECGVDLQRVLDPEMRPAGLALVSLLAGRARSHLEAAVRYTLCWPADRGRDVRLFCVVPLCLALATLREIESGDDTLRSGRNPKVPRSLVEQLVYDSTQAIDSNDNLEQLFARYGGRD